MKRKRLIAAALVGEIIVAMRLGLDVRSVTLQTDNENGVGQIFPTVIYNEFRSEFYQKLLMARIAGCIYDLKRHKNASLIKDSALAIKLRTQAWSTPLLRSILVIEPTGWMLDSVEARELLNAYEMFEEKSFNRSTDTLIEKITLMRARLDELLPTQAAL